MHKPKYIIKENLSIIAESEIASAINERFFQAQYWAEQKQILGQAQGRGTTWFFKWHHHEYVLRHYRRGGFIGKFLNDQYLYTGLPRSYPWREWHLLDRPYQSNLPVPKPAACQIIQHKFYYTADLITHKIPNTLSLAQHLKQNPLSDDLWHNIGETLKLFHEHNVYHADLNAHNILLDNKGKVWLIDFHKSSQKKMTPRRCQINLERLERSLLKLTGLNDHFCWKKQNWETLITAYEENPSL